jgi:ABC-type transport system involved in multi-copper enzyme maturation permease subunit
VLSGGLLIAVPAILGMFWGAPLVAREFETGTYRMIWTQSVSRARWLGVKLAGAALAGLLVTGVFTALLTWAADPVDDITGNRFGTFSFDSRNLVPLGYALFALALGTTAGLLLRRTLAAIAVTVVVFALVQVAMPLAIRPHLVTPVTTSVKVDATSLEHAGGLGISAKGPSDVTANSPVLVLDYEVANAWMLSKESRILQASGKPVDGRKADACFRGGGPAQAGACLAAMNVHFDVTYQPGSRYWLFQGLETAIFTALALLLAGFSLLRIRRSLG